MKSIPLSRFTYNFAKDRDGETNSLPSMTTPDQNLSLREMLRRYSRGQSVTTFDPVYDGDEDLPDLSGLTKIELEELRMDVLGEIKYQRNRIERIKHAAQNAAEAPEDATLVSDDKEETPTD